MSKRNNKASWQAYQVRKQAVHQNCIATKANPKKSDSPWFINYIDPRITKTLSPLVKSTFLLHKPPGVIIMNQTILSYQKINF